MFRGDTMKRNTQAGMTLVETLVAITVFTIVFLAALGLYQAANRAYMATDAATIQQQNARFAMDRVAETLREAGANYSPTGAANIPDEQIEGAWESAIFVRGDFDDQRECGSAAGCTAGATQKLENLTFPIVTTGNDEIVGYVLRKPSANSVNITIKADLTTSGGRDAVKSGSTITGEETATIAVAASDLAGQTSPPYQLVRVNFDSSGTPQYQVIAENIFRLSFKLMNDAGTEVVTASTATGGADADRGTRATIRKVGVSIVSMTDRPDFGYTDPNTYTSDAFGHTAPAEGTSTKPYRKFTLTEEIAGPSLGRKGARHNAVPAVTIAAPPTLTVCAGHDQWFYLTWDPSPTAGIATYQVHITATSPAMDFPVLVPTTEYRFKQIDPTVQPYSFQVAGAAVSATGTFSSTATKQAWHDLVNSIPSVPTNVAASAGTGNSVNVTWTPVTTNTGTLATTHTAVSPSTDTNTCTTVGTGAGNYAAPAPWNTEAVDLGSYQIYRGLYPNKVLAGTFAPTDPGVVRVDNLTVGDITNTTPTFGSSFTDNTAAPCGQYFYRMRAFDTANLVAPGNGSTAMAAAAKYIPAAGVTPAAPALAPAVNGTVTVAGGNFSFALIWADVVRDSTGANATVSRYTVERQKDNIGGSFASPLADDTFDVYDTASFQEGAVAPFAPVNFDYRYRVRAVYDCTAVGDVDRNSGFSPWFALSCTPAAGNTLAVSVPVSGSAISRPYETGATPQLTTGGTGWTSATLVITDAGGTIVYGPSTISGAPDVSNHYTFPYWDASALADGTYTVTANATVGSCRRQVTSTFTVETGTCGLQLNTVAFTGGGANLDNGLDFTVRNTCDSTAPITVSGLRLTWTGVSTALLAPARNISKIQYNGVDKTLALTAANGSTVTFTQGAPLTVTINGASTSNTFHVNFNGPMTSTGDKFGTPGKFPSILATVTAPLSTTDELVVGAPVP